MRKLLVAGGLSLVLIAFATAPALADEHGRSDGLQLKDSACRISNGVFSCDLTGINLSAEAVAFLQQLGCTVTATSLSCTLPGTVAPTSSEQASSQDQSTTTTTTPTVATSAGTESETDTDRQAADTAEADDQADQGQPVSRGDDGGDHGGGDHGGGDHGGGD